VSWRRSRTTSTATGSRSAMTSSQITKRLDITSAVQLAACSKELCRPVAGLHHWGGPCLLVPDPSRSHYDDNTAGDTV
jgi:hypothetical protein